MRLQCKVAVITGSSRGIGRAVVALGYACEGARVVLNYAADTASDRQARDRQQAEATLDAVRAVGTEALLVEADVSKADQVQHLCECHHAGRDSNGDGTGALSQSRKAGSISQ